jgi:hypothetical protein
VAERAGSDLDEHIMFIKVFPWGWYFMDFVGFIEL